MQQARAAWGWSCRWWVVGLVLLATVVCREPLPAQTARPVVYVVPIAGVIDLGLAPFVRRVLEEAAGVASDQMGVGCMSMDVYNASWSCQ